MHDALGDALTIKARQLLNQVVILQQHRPIRSCGLRILVISNRRAGCGS